MPLEDTTLKISKSSLIHTASTQKQMVHAHFNATTVIGQNNNNNNTEHQMQAFFFECSDDDSLNNFVPCMVYLPVKSRVEMPLNIRVTLKPMLDKDEKMKNDDEPEKN